MLDDSRKWTLIVLGLVLIVSVSSFFFTGFSPEKRPGQLDITGTKNQNSSPLRSGYQTGNSSGQEAAIMEPVRLPSSNATENLAYLLSNNTAISYQAGVATKGAFAPVSKEAVSAAVTLVATKALEETNVTPSTFVVIEKPTIKEVETYFEQVTKILKEEATNPAVDQVAKNGITLTKIRAAQAVFATQEKKILALKVPKNFLEVHKKLLSLTRNYRLFFESAAHYKDDPLKAVFVVQNKQPLLARQGNDLVNEIKKLTTKKAALTPTPLEELLGIKKVEAQQAVFDATVFGQAIANFAEDVAFYAEDLANWATEYAQKILEWTRKLATEQMKNTLIQLFVKQTVGWVNGGGEAQFVTNWKLFAQDATARGTQKGFTEISDSACATFGPSIIRQLGDSYNTFYRPENCRKSPTGEALGQFRDNNFFDGGWGAYGLAISPKGNYFQSYVENSTKIGELAAEEKEAAQNDALANSGFKSTKICIDTPGTPAPDPDGSCPDGSEPINTTPGVALKATLDKALQAPVDRIANADDLVDLGFILSNSALSNIVSAKEKGLSGLLGGGNIAGSPTDPANLNLESTCASYEENSTEYSSCMLIAGASTGSASQIITNLDNQITTAQQ